MTGPSKRYGPTSSGERPAIDPSDAAPPSSRPQLQRQARKENSPPAARRRGYLNKKRPRSELGRQVAVDFESDADFDECGSCPVHSLLRLCTISQHKIGYAPTARPTCCDFRARGATARLAQQRATPRADRDACYARWPADHWNCPRSGKPCTPLAVAAVWRTSWQVQSRAQLSAPVERDPPAKPSGEITERPKK
jgi:hypothetical protein